MANFIPKNVFRTINSDGSKSSTTQWSYGEIGSGTSIYPLLIGFLVCLLLSTIASPILLIISIITFTGRTQIINILGLIIGVYFLFDCNHNWLALKLANLLLDDNKVAFLMALNVGAIFGNIILLLISFVFGETIFNQKDSKKPMIVLSVIIVFICIGFIIGTNVKENVFKQRNHDRITNNIGSTNYDGSEKTEAEREETNRRIIEENNEIQRKYDESDEKKHDDEIAKRWGN